MNKPHFSLYAAYFSVSQSEIYLLSPKLLYL